MHLKKLASSKSRRRRFVPRVRDENAPRANFVSRRSFTGSAVKMPGRLKSLWIGRKPSLKLLNKRKRREKCAWPLR